MIYEAFYFLLTYKLTTLFNFGVFPFPQGILEGIFFAQGINTIFLFPVCV